MKKLIKNTGLLIILAGILQIVVVMVYPGVPPRALSIKKAVEKNADIAYFGSSVMFWDVPRGEGQTIAYYLEQQLLDYTVSNLAINAATIHDYLEISRYMIRKGYRPKYAIFPINLRSFLPEWNRHPLHQHEKELDYLRKENFLYNLVYKPLNLGKRVKLKYSFQDYLSAIVYDGEKPIGRLKHFVNEDFNNFTTDHLVQRIHSRYMQGIKKDHPHVGELRMLARLLKENGITPIFYFESIDYQTGKKYLGPRFRHRMEDNIAVIQSVLHQEGVEAMNLAFFLTSAYFTWREDPDSRYMNEHLSEEGKQHLAARIAKGIQ